MSEPGDPKRQRKKDDKGGGSAEATETKFEDSNSSAFMVSMIILATIAAFLAIDYAGGMGTLGTNTTSSSLPAQAVKVDFLSFAVLGLNGTFRNSSEPFNPTRDTPPFFQVFSDEFLDVLGPDATIRLIAQNESFAFAHEAPIWVPAADEVFFASNDGGALGMSDLNHNNQVSKISLKDPSLASGGLINPTKVPLSDDVQMTNGGTPFRSELLLITSGRGNFPPSLVRVNPNAPYNTTVLLDNYFGRQFNSLNDIKVHPTTGKLFFTDVTYGFLNHFRPLPQMPNQVYRLDPDSGSLRVVADAFVRCNGIAFTGDGNTAYITDTGQVGFDTNQTEPATIYAFDVDARTQAFTNRRTFAYVDNGVPDGIQIDTEGRVYSGTGDGVQVWNSEVILAETAIYLAHIQANGLPLEDF